MSVDASAILELSPVLPLLTVSDVEHAVPAARALAEGGLRAVEVTLRTPEALESLRRIVRDVPEITAGAGTLTRPEEMEQVRHAGGVFAVSPGFLPELAEAARAAGLPWLPGVATASEMMAARAAGLHALKLFPAAALGRGLLRSVRGPLPDLRFCPTGGLDGETFRDWLELPNVPCVGGSWIAPSADLEAGDWDAIADRARRCLA